MLKEAAVIRVEIISQEQLREMCVRSCWDFDVLQFVMQHICKPPASTRGLNPLDNGKGERS